MDLRRMVEGLPYVLGTGRQRRRLPKEFPPYSTLWGYLGYDGALARSL